MKNIYKSSIIAKSLLQLANKYSCILEIASNGTNVVFPLHHGRPI